MGAGGNRIDIAVDVGGVVEGTVDEGLVVVGGSGGGGGIAAPGSASGVGVVRTKTTTPAAMKASTPANLRFSRRRNELLPFTYKKTNLRRGQFRAWA
jgi:hypothetical protein